MRDLCHQIAPCFIPKMFFFFYNAKNPKITSTYTTMSTPLSLTVLRGGWNGYVGHIHTRPACKIFFIIYFTWWRHQMETFSALLAICAGNSPVPGEFPTQRPVTRSFDDFFDLRLNKRLSKQWRGWWFETLSRPLWSYRNEMISHSNILV